MKGAPDHTTDSRLSDVAYVESMHALVVRFLSGRVYAVPLAELEGRDASAVTGVSLGSDGYAAVIEQHSGNRLDVPWDVILYYAEPEYPFYKRGAKVANAAAGRQEIGERIRLERLGRHWTLADLGTRTGIKVPNLSRLEKGKHLPSLETLEKVAGAFELPVAALVSARRSARVAL
jgi:DNA-binding XRE family transcriptional regulator